MKQIYFCIPFSVLQSAQTKTTVQLFGGIIGRHVPTPTKPLTPAIIGFDAAVSGTVGIKERRLTAVCISFDVLKEHQPLESNIEAIVENDSSSNILFRATITEAQLKVLQEH